MPYTLNGIGTMHYGRKNLFTAHSRCEACGAYGELRSYDTRHWFTIVFVPIIPLGSRRVFGHCPACDRFYMMPLRKWREAKKNSVRELERVSAGAVTDTDSAVAAIGSAASFQSPELIDEHAPSIASRFARQASVLRALSEAYLYLGDTSTAQTYAEQALEADDGDDAHILLGRIMIAAGNLDDARACLDRIVDERLIAYAPVLTNLIRAYQHLGRHQDALVLIEEIETAFPEAATNQTVQKLKKLSSKYLKSGKPIVPKATKQRRPILVTAGAAFFGLMLVLGLSVWVIEEWEDAGLQDVWLVNGLDRPYGIEVGSDTLELPKKSVVRWDLPGGPVRVKSTLKALENSDVQINIPGSTWSRFGGENVFVINLDQMAMLDWQQYGYADDDLPNREERLGESYEYKPYFGELTYDFSGLDYPFKAAPDELDLPSSSSILERTELMIDTETTPSNMANFIWEQFGEEKAVWYVENLFRLHPPDATHLSLLFEYAPEDTFLKHAFKRMRQGDVEYHRSLQEYAKTYLDESDIRAHYEELLATNPADGDLIYLVGRTFDDARRSRSYYERAVAGPNPSGYAYNAMAFNALCAGRFEEGRELSRQALGIEPRNPAFLNVGISLALAERRYVAVLELARKKSTLSKPRDGVDFEAMRYEVLALNSLKGPDSAHSRISELSSLVQTDFQRAGRTDAEDAAQAVRQFLSEIVDYANCAGKGLEELGVTYGNETYLLEHQLREGIFEDVEAVLAAPNEWSWDTHLMYAIGALLHDRPEADDLLAAAASQMAQLGGEHAIFADLLNDSRRFDAELAANLSTYPSVKTLSLTALYLIKDDAPESLGDLASALSYEYYVPHYLIETAIEARRSGGLNVGTGLGRLPQAE